MAFGFRGPSLQIYGAPPRELEKRHQTPGKQEICLQGFCREINTQELYDFVSEGNQNLPVLLFSTNDLVGSQYHRLELRLLDSSGGRQPVYDMTVHHLVYQEREAMLPPSYEPSGEEEIVHTTYYDTNPWISYSPSTACHPSPLGCVEYQPWKREIFALPAGHNQTFTHTSSWENGPTNENIRMISFTFRGVALYIYGASKIQIDRIGDVSYEHAHQEICIDNDCHAIDTHQIYLNLDERHAYEPVLLWSYDRYPSTALRHVQLRLLDKDSPVGHIRRMTFNRFVVSEVHKLSPWRHPIPGATYTHLTVQSKALNLISYYPEMNCAHGDCHHPYAPWEKQTYIVPGGQELSFYHTSTWDHKPKTRQRSWEFKFTGHTIKVYCAPRPYLVHAAHARQEVCLDDFCAPIDAERAYLMVEPDVEHYPVLLWSMDNIDVAKERTLTVRMIESGDEAGKVIKRMTFSHLEYTKVVLPPPELPVKTKPNHQSPRPNTGFDFELFFSVIGQILSAFFSTMADVLGIIFVIAVAGGAVIIFLLSTFIALAIIYCNMPSTSNLLPDQPLPRYVVPSTPPEPRHVTSNPLAPRPAPAYVQNQVVPPYTTTHRQNPIPPPAAPPRDQPEMCEYTVRQPDGTYVTTWVRDV
ncbi:hypothetical protein FRB95_008644 [Tulasnella sp. JGI-2019a]|nr:hypothetical protein FRB95_008644 [Tulasnella sp. JGI-2019a]